MKRRIFLYGIVLAIVSSLLAGSLSCGSEDSGDTRADSSTTATRTEKSSTKKKDQTRSSSSTGSAAGLPNAEQIQEDLIDESIVDPHLGEWFFESTDEFIEFDIVDQEVADDRAEFVIDVKLEDINDGRQYNGQLNVTYEKRASDSWRLVDVTGEYRSAQPSV